MLQGCDATHLGPPPPYTHTRTHLQFPTLYVLLTFSTRNSSFPCLRGIAVPPRHAHPAQPPLAYASTLPPRHAPLSVQRHAQAGGRATMGKRRQISNCRRRIAASPLHLPHLRASSTTHFHPRYWDWTDAILQDARRYSDSTALSLRYARAKQRIYLPGPYRRLSLYSILSSALPRTCGNLLCRQQYSISLVPTLFAHHALRGSRQT